MQKLLRKLCFKIKHELQQNLQLNHMGLVIVYIHNQSQSFALYIFTLYSIFLNYIRLEFPYCFIISAYLQSVYHFY